MALAISVTGELAEIPTLGLRPRLSESEPLGRGPAICYPDLHVNLTLAQAGELLSRETRQTSTLSPGQGFSTSALLTLGA